MEWNDDNEGSKKLKAETFELNLWSQFLTFNIFQLLKRKTLKRWCENCLTLLTDHSSRRNFIKYLCHRYVISFFHHSGQETVSHRVEISCSHWELSWTLSDINDEKVHTLIGSNAHEVWREWNMKLFWNSQSWSYKNKALDLIKLKRNKIIRKKLDWDDRIESKSCKWKLCDYKI